MSLYEHVFICRQDISQQQVESLTVNLTTILAEQGGSVEKTEYWGLRSLAYRVRKNRKGGDPGLHKIPKQIAHVGRRELRTQHHQPYGRIEALHRPTREACR